MLRLCSIVGVAAAAFTTAAVLAQADRPADPARRQPDAASTAYVGSGACQRCHEAQYDSWKRTLHVQMTKPIAEARVEGDFGGAQFSQYGRSYTMETRDGRYFITIARDGRPPERFEVNYTLGARRLQGYLSKLADGRIYVLPIFWHNETKRWIDFKEITPIPDDPSLDLRQIWNVTCVNCHATNLAKNYDVASGAYRTTWTEMGIGCEACHGPGRDHVALTSAWERDPSTRPAYDSSANNPRLGETLKIFSVKAATPRQIFDTCGYCHGNKNNVFFGFKPGDRYEDYALPFLISQPAPDHDPQGDYWPDGRPNRFNRPQALTLTGCFRRGQATCTSCHRMHGSGNDHALKVPVEAPGGGHTRQSDLLCTQCHAIGQGTGAGSAGDRSAPASADRSAPASADRSAPASADRNAPASADRSAKASAEREPTPIPNLEAHTHHRADSQGSRCIECHMSDVNWRLFTRRRDHTFQPPVPELTARYGEPNACTTCHDDKPPEWAAALMDTWYGNRDRRQAVVALSDVIYRAGSGETSALAEVARVAVDRSRGALIRASAAEFAGQLIARTEGEGTTGAGGDGSAKASAERHVDPATVNALIGAAADPEGMVRIAAIRALGLIDERRLAPVLISHLGDPSRVVRARAAEALFNLGMTALPGPPGEALAKAQDEWAESLRTFADEAADHATLGWLEAARGRSDDAVKELNVAVRLDRAAPRPHLYLGVIAARAGRYDQAVQEFKAVKTLAPGYPNIDRLIDEAQKRR
jgi:HEAT repeat protein/cytochrome c554/c'-like protein/doubled CXXCH motif protein